MTAGDLRDLVDLPLIGRDILAYLCLSSSEMNEMGSEMEMFHMPDPDGMGWDGMGYIRFIKQLRDGVMAHVSTLSSPLCCS